MPAGRGSQLAPWSKGCGSLWPSPHKPPTHLPPPFLRAVSHACVASPCRLLSFVQREVGRIPISYSSHSTWPFLCSPLYVSDMAAVASGSDDCQVGQVSEGIDLWLGGGACQSDPFNTGSSSATTCCPAFWCMATEWISAIGHATWKEMSTLKHWNDLFGPA